MAFQYSYFVSYRQNQAEDYKKFMQKFVAKLSENFESSTNTKKCFLDIDGIRVSENIDIAIPPAIRQSAFFLVWFTENYFHKDNIYCTREFLFAKNVEAARKNILQTADEELKNKHRIIIPVIKNENAKKYYSEVPELKAIKYCIDLSALRWGNNKIHPEKKFDDVVKEIVNCVAEVANMYRLNANSDDLIDCTQSLDFPTEQQAKDYIESIFPTVQPIANTSFPAFN